MIVGGIEEKVEHSAYEVLDLDALGQGQQVLRAQGHRHMWGIGRHLLGSQLFDYWFDPDGFEYEHYTDGDVFTADVETAYSPLEFGGIWAWGDDAPASMKPKKNLRTLLHVLKLVRRKAITPQRLKLHRARHSMRPPAPGSELLNHHTMSRTIIRYAEDGTPRWGVQFGRLIAPLQVDAPSTGELLSGHWDALWAAEPDAGHAAARARPAAAAGDPAPAVHLPGRQLPQPRRRVGPARRGLPLQHDLHQGAFLHHGGRCAGGPPRARAVARLRDRARPRVARARCRPARRSAPTTCRSGWPG